MAKRRKRPGSLSVPACGGCAYRSILESNPDGLLVIGGKGKLRFCNRAASELLGIPLRPGLSLPDQTGGSRALQELLHAPNGTRLIRVPQGLKKGERVLEVRTVYTQWEGETALLVNLHEAPPRSQGNGKRWSPLLSMSRGLRASTPVCTHCGSHRFERVGGGSLARAVGLVGHRCLDCHTVFHLPRRLASTEKPLLAEAAGEEPLKVEEPSDPVTPDALRALDRLVEALPKAESPSKSDA